MPPFEIKVLERTENSLTLLMKGVPTVFANAIRRALISRVPVFAIDVVAFVENTTNLPDEYIAHRLGLVPLTSDVEGYLLPEECDCGSPTGCPKCSVVLRLDVKAEGSEMTVYSRDIVSENPNVVPVSGDIPVIKLAQGQRLKLEMWARLGTGSKHAKWQPVSVAVARPLPVIEVNEEACDGCGKCVEACVEGALKVDGEKVKVVDLLACSTCKDCEAACPKGAISASWDEESSILHFESVGQLPPEKLLEKALTALIKDLDKFEEGVRGVRKPAEG